MSVDLPAPFSPSRAWTSPARRSKSTPSLATIRPKRFVIPRSSSAVSMNCRRPPGLRRAADGVRRGDLAGCQLLLDRRDLRLVLRAGLADLADPDAVVRDGVERVRPALVLVLLDGEDLLEDRHVDLLQRAREHLRAEVGLVGVYADCLHALLLGRVDGAEPALAGDLEDDLRALGDLVERDPLALRLVDEVLRVAVQELHARVGLLRAGLEARDVVVDRRDLLTADGAERAAVVLGVQAREIADQVAGLLLLEEQALDVLGLALQQRRRRVDDRELHVRELLRDRRDRVGHEEADPDHEVVLLLGKRREVRDVVGVGLRDQGAALDPELLLRVLEALVGQEVERAVVEAADVGHEPDLELRAARRRGRRRAAAGAAARAAAAATCRDAEGADGQAEGDRDRPGCPAVHCSSFAIPPRGSGLPPLPARSLRRAPVGVAKSLEQGRPELRLGEARLDRRPRDRPQLGVAPPEALARDRVLAPDRGAEVGRVVGGERDLDARFAQRRQGVGLIAVEDADHDVARRAALEPDPALGELGHERRVLDRPHAVTDPGDRQVERGADALGARPLAGVDAAPEAGLGRYRVGLGERPGRVAGLVARHLEADDVRVRALGGVAGDPQRRLDAEVADAREQDPRLDAVLGAGIVDARRDPVEVLGVGEPDERCVVRGGDELDIYRALGSAPAQVLVGDVAVVLRGADDARRHVVGLQEVEEVAPREAVGRGEHSVGDAQAVALGDPAHEVRRGGALQVDVQLGLRDHRGSARRSRTTGTSGVGGSPTVKASGGAMAARGAASGSRAWTTASGRSSGPTRSPGAATSERPTAWSIPSASCVRPPPSWTTTSPTRRTSIAVR